MLKRGKDSTTRAVGTRSREGDRVTASLYIARATTRAENLKIEDTLAATSRIPSLHLAHLRLAVLAPDTSRRLDSGAHINQEPGPSIASCSV
jgi:hypothetical protein